MAMNFPEAMFNEYFYPMLNSTNTDNGQWNCDATDYCFVTDPDCSSGCGCFTGGMEDITMQFGNTKLTMPPDSYT